MNPLQKITYAEAMDILLTKKKPLK